MTKRLTAEIVAAIRPYVPLLAEARHLGFDHLAIGPDHDVAHVWTRHEARVSLHDLAYGPGGGRIDLATDRCRPYDEPRLRYAGPMTPAIIRTFAETVGFLPSVPVQPTWPAPGVRVIGGPSYGDPPLVRAVRDTLAAPSAPAHHPHFPDWASR